MGRHDDARGHRDLIERCGSRGIRLMPLIEKKPPRGFRKYHGVGPFPADKLDAVRKWAAITHVGLVLPPDLIVLDVDVKDGKHGFQQLQELEAEFGPLPQSLRVPTPSGGQHMYFRVPEGHSGMRWRSSAEWQGHPHSDAAIDILHAKNRYAVLYAPSDVLDHLDEIEELPPLWLLPLCRRILNPTQRALGQVQHAMSAAGTLQRIAILGRTPKGSRHNQLRVTALDLLKFDPDGSALRSMIVDAALKTGLTAAEVMTTLASVDATLQERHGRVYAWARWAAGEIEYYPVRNRPRLRLAITCIAHTCIGARKQPVPEHGITLWLSARTLAFMMGVSPATAASLLQRLRSMGIIFRVDTELQQEDVEAQDDAAPPAIARTYRLARTASDIELDTQTLVRGADVGVYEEVSRVPLGSSQMRLQLADHNAFRNRRDGITVLPVACAELLLAMTSNRVHKSEVAQRLGVHPQTARRYRAILRAAGIVAEDSDGHLRFIEEDVIGLLDAYSQAVCVPDRRTSQLHRIQNDRAGYLQTRVACDADRVPTKVPDVDI